MELHTDHQITLEELGMIPKMEAVPEQKRDVQVNYAFPCGGCICNHCANSVECSDRCTGEADFGCFICDDCSRYDSIEHADNWRDSCSLYKVTNQYADRTRKSFRAVKPESEG